MATMAGWSQRQIKERRKAFRKHWPFLTGVVLALCLMTAMLPYVFLRDRQIPAWMLGPIVIVASFWAMRPQLDGTYQLQSGIDAEGWTSTDLKKALGTGWYVVDGISFGERGDVDHVVVGPAGVFAVESKYTDSTQASRSGRSMIRTWIDQSYDNARRVRLLLKYNYGQEIDVDALVVASGTEFMTLPTEVEDVDVVRRRNLGKRTSVWRGMPRVLSTEQVESIRAALLDWRGIRQDFERDRAK